jgi:hypothetical protein
MLESGLSGSVRGVPSNGHPYRDPRPEPDIRPDSLDTKTPAASSGAFSVDLFLLKEKRIRPIVADVFAS